MGEGVTVERKFPKRRGLLERPASEMSALEAGFSGHF